MIINDLIFKSGEEGAIGWSAAPTLVERQRENLTERLKREFGLFLSDDEEERARKHGIYILNKYVCGKEYSSFGEDEINYNFRKMKNSKSY